jgi:hypothetical protein
VTFRRESGDRAGRSSFSLPLSANKSAMVRLFTPPVVAEGRLFVRDQSRVLVYDLRAGSGTK